MNGCSEFGKKGPIGSCQTHGMILQKLKRHCGKVFIILKCLRMPMFKLIPRLQLKQAFAKNRLKNDLELFLCRLKT